MFYRTLSLMSDHPLALDTRHTGDQMTPAHRDRAEPGALGLVLARSTRLLGAEPFFTEFITGMEESLVARDMSAPARRRALVPDGPLRAARDDGPRTRLTDSDGEPAHGGKPPRLPGA
ncbi:hypothetical protein [Streptomyces hygroscopicus]|uniref:hypothetical protein n=1 Tax=Streptomyces hygroscopicus TaxID=1912 RepID=UPI0004C798A6|nr:hypothetical protein [Streptomyces hygroscopicus]